MSRMSVCEVLASTVAAEGVEEVFGLLGSGNMELVSHMTKGHGIRYTGARHEANAIGMAIGYSLATDRVGVSTVHQGPGFTNALTTLREAAISAVPLVLLCGETSTTARWPRQATDQAALARVVGARVKTVRSPQTAVPELLDAFLLAATERCPVVILLPLDIQHAELDWDTERELEGRSPSRMGVSRRKFEITGTPRAKEVEEIAELIGQSECPLFVGGRGAYLAGAENALTQLAERSGALLATTLLGKGLFGSNPFNLGVLGGFGTVLSKEYARKADLVIAFGASLSRYTTTHGTAFNPSATIVQIDTSPSAMGRYHRIDLGIVGDAGSSAKALEEALGLNSSRSTWRNQETSNAIRKPVLEFCDDLEDGIDPRSLCVALNSLLPKERTLVSDSGGFMGWAPMYMDTPDPAGFIFAQGFGAVGIGLGTALGAALGRPERLPVLIIGDGGLMMSQGELNAAIHHNIPVVIVVMNDAAYGAEVHHFRRVGISTVLAEFQRTDFAAIAEASGATGVSVKSIRDLETVKPLLHDLRGPLVIDAHISKSVSPEWLISSWRPGG